MSTTSGTIPALGTLASLRRYLTDASALLNGSLNTLTLPPKDQIPFLDGLRSVAILLVVNHHFSADFAATYGDTSYSTWFIVRNGWIGVDLFFVLSGFLIGGQLWRELADTGKISIGRFVMRRGLRIWPLYFFTYFCVVAIDNQYIAQRQYGWSDLLFLSNYVPNGVVLGGWSLCSEEQFYILAPSALMLLTRHLSARTVRIVLWITFASLPIIRAIHLFCLAGTVNIHNNHAAFADIYFKFHTHCDGLIIGLIISGLWESYGHTYHHRWKAGFEVLLAVIVMAGLRVIHHEIFGFTGLSLFFGALVWFGISSRPKYFCSKVFYWVSKLSFGMYLNHQYISHMMIWGVLPHIRFLRQGSAGVLLFDILLGTLLSSAISLMTYCIVEHPFIRLRKLVVLGQAGLKTSFLTSDPLQPNEP